MKRVRRKKSQDRTPIISPYRLAMKVYNSLLLSMGEILDSIYVKQQVHTGSPNFFYKGQVYQKIPKTEIHPLVNELRSEMDSYLKAVKSTDEIIDSFKFALVRFTTSGYTLSDLYYVLPYKHHHYLEEIPFTEKNDEYVLELQKNNFTEILELVNEQALYDLIG